MFPLVPTLFSEPNGPPRELSTLVIESEIELIEVWMLESAPLTELKVELKLLAPDLVELMVVLIP